MFIICGFGHKEFGCVDVSDDNNNRFTIFYIAQYFSVFFIPLFIFSKTYYIKQGEIKKEITKEEYKLIKQNNKIPKGYESKFNEYNNYSKQSDNEESTYVNEFCPICKNKLETSFAYCPYCGQKQPKA